MAFNQPRFLKTDTSFLEKVAMGAIGTRRVLENLEAAGHRPVALDRGSTSYKLWKAIKIKRLRVPDILCVASGIRVESRAKSKLEVSMSHSDSDPERGWDFGLNDGDYVAFPQCERIGEEPVAWRASELVQYVLVRDLRRAREDGLVLQEKPKGAEEGFETRLTWPSSVASSDCTVVEVTDSRVSLRRCTDERLLSLSLKRSGVQLRPMVRAGDTVRRGQIVSSVVSPTQQLPIGRRLDAHDYLLLLTSPSLSDRYASAKALCFFEDPGISGALKALLDEPKEHIYVKLEAAATLMRSGCGRGAEFLCSTLHGEYLENRLETVIVLGEVPSEESSRILTECLLDTDQHPEIRAGAAWSLGELRSSRALGALVQSFKEVEPAIRVEAARALAKVARRHPPLVLREFPGSSPQQRPGIAWALARAGGFSIGELLPLRIDDDARHWIAYMLGAQPEERFTAEIANLKQEDPEVHFAVNVLWKILTSWVTDLEEY